MGRYVSEQIFSDRSTKVVVASGYSDIAGAGSASSISNSNGDGGDDGGAAPGGADTGAAAGGELKPRAAQPEKVEVYVPGSNAGAGSSTFHTYRATRRRELDRMDNIEKNANREEHERKFAEKVARNRQEAEERTRKNAEKRKQKKMKKRQLKHARGPTSGLVGGTAHDGEDDDDDDEDNEDNDKDNEGGGKRQRVEHEATTAT